MKRSTIAILLLVSTANCIAQEENGAPFFACDDTVAINDLDRRSIFFANVQLEALRVNDFFCNQLNNFPDVPPEILDEFGSFLEDTASSTDFGSAELNSDVAAAMRIMSGALGEQRSTRFRMPDFDVDEIEDDFDFAFFFSVSVLDENNFIPDEDQRNSCKTRFAGVSTQEPNPECLQVFEDLETAILPYKRSYQAMIAKNQEQTFAEISADWSRYFETARTQTTLDLVLTSWLERSHMRQGFIVGPPKRQWFMLRPNMILQYNDGAPKGDQFKPGVSVEWAGFNYWDDSPLGFPFGLSVTSVYADMPDVASVGTGLSLHINNSFTIGWAKHGSDDSFHVSADLLQFVQDKQQQFDKYTGRFDSFFD
jgi:hypothetical protein